MNNKGFTLIEILGVIVILGLLFLLVAPPVLNSISAHKPEVDDAQKQMVEDATDLYLDSTNYESGCVLVSTLKSKGFLNEGFKNTTETEIVAVRYSTTNNVRSYNIVYSGYSTSGCS